MRRKDNWKLQIRDNKKNVGGAANQEEETKERQKKEKQIEYRCRRNRPYVNMFDANSTKVTICYLFIDM